MVFTLMILRFQASAAPAQLTRNLYCAPLAGSGIGLAGEPTGPYDRLTLDLILETTRLCPAEFVSAASLIAEYSTPLDALTSIGRSDPLTIRLGRDAANMLAKETQLKSDKTAMRLAGLFRKAKTGGVASVARDRENAAHAIWQRSLGT
jgi:hypothetical protein